MDGSRNKYVIVHKDKTPFSQVVNDCETGFCVPVVKGENLNSVLKKLCALIVSKVTPPPAVFPNSRVFNEELDGEKDGYNAIFYTAQVFQPTSTAVYYNGQRMKLGFDYNETGTSQITFTFPVFPTDVLIIDFNTINN